MPEAWGTLGYHLGAIRQINKDAARAERGNVHRTLGAFLLNHVQEMSRASVARAGR